MESQTVENEEPIKSKEIESVEIMVNLDAQHVHSATCSRSSSSNRFAILEAVKETEMENETGGSSEAEMVLSKDESLKEPRKAKAASTGMAELMQSLKPKKK